MASEDGGGVSIELAEQKQQNEEIPQSTSFVPAIPITAKAPTTPIVSPAATSPAPTTIITINNKVIDDETVTPLNAAVSSSSSTVPAHASTSRQLFQEAAAAHGGDETTSFLMQELNSIAHSQPSLQHPQRERLRSASSTLDGNISRIPSAAGKHEKKIGHRRVDEGGEVTYKRIQSKQIMGSIQLGIQHTIGSLASKPKRDLLMNDFWEMESIAFPPDGSSITPAHHFNDFRFKVYAPIAFRYFRDLFGIAPDDFLMSICAAPLRQLSNPGASGSIFYLSDDDEFIIKTVQKKECEFLQKLLPGYYMNLSQNPRTLLPKFFGLFCFNYNSKNVRLVAMNNLLPTDIKMHAKYDLKGSTHGRKASKEERQKASPTFKDLDFMKDHPNGIFLETDKYNALMRTIQRDCTVLESFQIMDYSLLVGIHNLDMAQKEKREERIRNARAKLQRNEELRDGDDAPVDDHQQISIYNYAPAQGAGGNALSRSRSMNRQRLVAHSTALESITADIDSTIDEDEDVPVGGLPARSENDERLLLYIGIIDILQSYRLEKKLEHTFKSIIYNGDTVSVCRPSFYAQRFQNFMGKTVFKKTPTFPLKHSPSKRKTSTVTLRTPQRMPPAPSAGSNVRQNMVSGSSTPPPPFDDISEEDMTASSSTGIPRSSLQSNSRNLILKRSFGSPNRSVPSSPTDVSSDDEGVSVSGTRSPLGYHSPQGYRSPRLSKTSIQLTTIGCVEDIVDQLPSMDGTASTTTVTSKAPGEKVQENGGQHIVTTKTIDLKAASYTSTVVVNDVVR